MRLRSLGLLCAIAIDLLVAACAAPTAGNAPSLEGRWKNTGGTIYFSDGTTIGPVTACWIEFSKNQSISECTSSRGKDRIVYAYRVLAPGQYESEVVENKNFPQYAGTRIRTDFKIENGTLFTTSYPPAPKGSTSKFPVKVQSTWVRD
jgi:hypothetical protein